MHEKRVLEKVTFSTLESSPSTEQAEGSCKLHQFLSKVTANKDSPVLASDQSRWEKNVLDDARK